MAIIDPPIKDNSSFYKNTLYQTDIIENNDNSSVLNEKYNAETISRIDGENTDPYDSDENVDSYSIKVNLIVCFQTYIYLLTQ